jgi:hypothetical protein
MRGTVSDVPNVWKSTAKVPTSNLSSAEMESTSSLPT